MDLGTENRLAALLLEEARRLRMQAEKEGVHAYLQKPNVRHRPNSRFLAATVLGVQHANRVVEVNEMWRAREKELELESKMKSRTNGLNDWRSQKRKNDSRDQSPVSKIQRDRPYGASFSSRDSHSSSYSDQEDGLGDDEIEEFLRSRVKRGRGAIGSRMDEPGPYLKPPSSRQDNSANLDAREKEERKRRVYGPVKPLFLRSMKYSDEEPSTLKHKHIKEEKKNSSNRERKEENRRAKHHHREHKSRSRE
ncbi:nucleolar protein 58 [Hordeum vulgare]|nr:nucleolar protein 58 [Hordeum vulgare]